MKINQWLLAILLGLSAAAYADDQQEVTQGAQAYDWQTCINDKMSDCTNACSNSEDVDCTDNCQSLANDKCQSEGLTPPSQ